MSFVFLVGGARLAGYQEGGSTRLSVDVEDIARSTNRG